MEKLAIFDVDFTLTSKESLLQFYKFMVKKKPKLWVHAPYSMFSGLMYALKFYDAHKAKENFLAFIDGIHEDEMIELVKEFYEEVFSKMLYADSIDMIKKLKREGCKVYLISASPEIYLTELYNIEEVDMIIGTRLHSSEKVYCRGINGKNCKGEEKVDRLYKYLKENNIEVDFENSYMFSDSLADLPLLELVGNPYLINHKKGYKDMEVLKWK